MKFKKVSFNPAYLTRVSKTKYAQLGKKGVENIPQPSLNNKVGMPMVIVGTAGIAFDKRQEIIYNAAKLGYYMFDTGMQTMDKPIYYNHEYIKELNNVYGRGMIGISTKVPSFAHGYHSTIHNLISQLKTLNTDYFDLVVIEHPDCRKNIKCEGHWIDTWRALEYLYEKKRIRALGVSQFSVSHLNILMKHKQKHIPLSVVRDWRDPLHPNNIITEWCETNNVQFQAFSPLGGQQLTKSSLTGNPILRNPTIKRIAKKHNIEAAQVVIKWNLQHGIGVIIRTSNIKHLESNLNTFDSGPLSEKDINDINSLGYEYNPKKETIKFTIPSDGNAFVESGAGTVINNDNKNNKNRNKKKRYRNVDNDLQDQGNVQDL